MFLLVSSPSRCRFDEMDTLADIVKSAVPVFVRMDMAKITAQIDDPILQALGDPLRYVVRLQISGVASACTFYDQMLMVYRTSCALVQQNVVIVTWTTCSIAEYALTGKSLQHDLIALSVATITVEYDLLHGSER